jgi:hypothetical protein
MRTANFLQRLLWMSLCALFGLMPVQADITLHVVKKGETAFSITKRYGVSLSELEMANPKLKVRQLKRGQVLKIPVKDGGTRTKPTPTPSRSEEKPRPEAPRAESAPQAGFIFVGPVKRQIDAARVRPGRWRYLVLHHSGTPSGNATIFNYFHKNIRHMENGLAYHFVIGNGNDSGDGQIEVGSRWTKQIRGGHLHSEALNEVSIGICFVGNFDESRPSRKQEAAAIELITYLNRICGRAPQFKLHREINPRPTACPGKLFPAAAFHRLFG